ncbi:hypothetical protein BC937DRAFT_91970 [Endogone sp. FLAS-F59071]|nr:hypothetical protein BC937DRAFT_91970 [Endogone sp. FLAS-F59071]|eukprot:RUS15811.1 hypothetical protein BC937DRAFT_91970 [Endogone sp. FLAS-F59071]
MRLARRTIFVDAALKPYALMPVPVVEVKDAPVEIPPEKDERWRCPMLDQLLRELIAQERQEEERQVQERRMREQLDQERRQFTEAAIKMGKERAALRAEREAFEEEKRSLQTQALLFSLSETS